MAKIVITGGGIIGLFSAYYLLKEGHEVTILNSGDPNNNCSTGNAGMIVPSHVIPLAAPGVVLKGMKWMFSPKSPFSINFRLNREWAHWGWLFLRSSNQKNVEKSYMHLRNISLYSKDLYRKFIKEHSDTDFVWTEKGLLMIYRTKAGEHDELAAASVAIKAGLAVNILKPHEVFELEPQVSESIRGAVHYPDDALISPSILTRFLYDYLISKGVLILNNQHVTGFTTKNRRVVEAITENGRYSADNFLIAAGALSHSLAKSLSLTMPIMAGKGYSFVYNNNLNLRQPSILSERKVTVSPYRNIVRFGGTMEITGLSTRVSKKRVEGIAESIAFYYKGGETVETPNVNRVWSGLRPVSSDGLPYIGNTSYYQNAFFASGHSMLGVSLAPATGKIISDIISGMTPGVDISIYSPDRFM